MFEEMALKQQLNGHNSIDYYSRLSFIEWIAGEYGVCTNRRRVDIFESLTQGPLASSQTDYMLESFRLPLQVRLQFLNAQGLIHFLHAVNHRSLNQNSYQGYFWTFLTCWIQP